MSAKQYLSGAFKITVKLKAMSEQLMQLKSAAEYIVPPNEDMPKSATRNIRRNEDAIVKIIEWEDKMNAEYARLADINNTINAVPDPQLQSLLVKRYIQGYSWETIAGELFVGSSRIYQLHKAALAEVERIIAPDSQITVSVS